MLRNAGVDRRASLAVRLARWRPSAPAAQAFEPFVVKDIRVEGLQRTEAGTVFSYLPVKVGETIDDEKARAGAARAVRHRLLQGRAPRGEGDVLVVIVRSGRRSRRSTSSA